VCTILLAWRCFAEASVVLAANRDELVARPSAPPGLLDERPRIFGGRDLVAGGTWLAVAVDGRVAAVTNRRVTPSGEVTRDPSRRSRGEIPTRLLTEVDEADIPAALTRLGPRVYNPVNVLYASPRCCFVAHVDDAGPPRVIELAPGPHVLTVFDVDDASQPKPATLLRRLEVALAEAPTPDRLMAGLRELLADPQSPTEDPLDAACIHGDVYGTVSASTVVIGDAGVAYSHAAGMPDETAFVDVPIGAADAPADALSTASW
jgi:uncharacterized protein with NRDE domain